MALLKTELVARHEACRPDEWPALLDVQRLHDEGWRPRPFQQFVLKILSRCNLACDYCYVYEAADQGWKHQPVRMPEATVRRAAERIAEHTRSHDIGSVQVTLHGGEPLLAGPRAIASIVDILRSTIERDGREVDLAVQTNGTMVDGEMVRVLSDGDVRVAFSYDGDPAVHDAHRVHRDGRGSYDELARGIALLQEYRPDLYSGILCVVDVRSDPVATFENVLGFRPPAMDFLLPHATWASPPFRPEGGSEAAYGEWLIAAFDRWYDAPERETAVRFFDGIVRGVLGRPSRVETVGLSPATVVVVEADGSIEQTDALKAAYDGAAHTGLDVFRHAFDVALGVPQIVARQIGVAGLSPTCQGCDLRPVCGGGFYGHRYRPGRGFLNPSVYCADLELLIRHVHARVRDDLEPRRHRPPPAAGERCNA